MIAIPSSLVWPQLSIRGVEAMLGALYVYNVLPH
jgi:hypothetical protein